MSQFNPIDLTMEDLLEKEMQEMEAHIAHLTVQEDVASIVHDLVDEIAQLEPPTKQEVAVHRQIQRELSGCQSPEVNLMLEQCVARNYLASGAIADGIAEYDVIALAHKYESIMAFAECEDELGQFVARTKIPTFIQQPPPGLVRSTSVFGNEITVVIHDRQVPPKMARCSDDQPQDYDPAFVRPTMARSVTEA